MSGRAAVPGRYNGGRGPVMTSQKTITLADDLFEQVERRAAAEGKTADELANELLGPLMELREQADAGDQHWRDLVTYGQGQAEKLGIREEDVDA